MNDSSRASQSEIHDTLPAPPPDGCDEEVPLSGFDIDLVALGDDEDDP